MLEIWSYICNTTTLSMKALNITSLRITTLSIAQKHNTQHNDAECWVLLCCIPCILSVMLGECHVCPVSLNCLSCMLSVVKLLVMHAKCCFTVCHACWVSLCCVLCLLSVIKLVSCMLSVVMLCVVNAAKYYIYWEFLCCGPCMLSVLKLHVIDVECCYVVSCMLSVIKMLTCGLWILSVVLLCHVSWMLLSC